MNTSHLNSNLDYALHYAKLGWHVFPTHTIIDGKCSCQKKKCTSPGKHPKTQHGLKDATIDTSLINKWWTQNPEANIAIRTGKESGIVAVDIDLKSNGFESLEQLNNLSQYLKTTLMSITGGGGSHLIFQNPEEPIKTRANLLPGIDIRGENGYITAPPSRHISGSCYEWFDLNLKPVKMSEWLIDEINNTSVNQTQDNPTNKIIFEGHRNNYLTSVGGKYWNQGVKKTQLKTFLLEENHLNCKPPLLESEVIKIYKSLCQYTQGKTSFLQSWKKAIRSSNLPSSSKLILHTLADHMNGDGRSCYPTQQMIADETSFIRKTIKTHIEICLDRGFITRYKHKSEHQKYINHGYIAKIPD